VVVSSWGLGATPEEIARSREGGLVGRAFPLPRAALEPIHSLLDPALVHATDPPLTHAAVAPVHLASSASAGFLIAGFQIPPPDRAQTLWIAESFAALIALCLHATGLLDRLLSLGGRDGLTGCLSYEGTCRQLSREINRSTRGGLDLSCCFIDLDGFKLINDEHGHQRGNDVLAHVGGILRGGVRSCDTVGRYGGDEFVAILPQTSESGAQRIAERLRSVIANADIPGLDRPITASIGVADWLPGLSAEQLLARADGALLTAKTLGAGIVSADGGPRAVP
jgi:diguanylate cyclase (GGDEF)-like protein